MTKGVGIGVGWAKTDPLEKESHFQRKIKNY